MPMTRSREVTPELGEAHVWRIELKGEERHEEARRALREILAGYLGGAPEGVARGEVELGLGPVSEIIPTPGVQVAGFLPAEIQSYLVLTAAISASSKEAAAAQNFIKFLTAPSALPVLTAKGMDQG